MDRNYRKPDTNRAMGIELECCMERLPGRRIGFFVGKEDVSIQPSNVHRAADVEWASQPLPKAWLKKELERLVFKCSHRRWEYGSIWHRPELFGPPNGWDTLWESNDTCGIHVHVSRKWMTKKKANIIQEWYASIGGDAQKQLFGRQSNYYCAAEAEIGSRYNAINQTNKETIEFRMFASGNVKWAQYCLDMVDYLITNANTLNLDAALAFREMHGKVAPYLPQLMFV